tara:strand:+ start:563 stop:691 length:129 start_codon:yes stop_codon:yes gene_type:complete
MRGADISQRHCRAIALSLDYSKWRREKKNADWRTGYLATRYD